MSIAPSGPAGTSGTVGATVNGDATRNVSPTRETSEGAAVSADIYAKDAACTAVRLAARDAARAATQGRRQSRRFRRRPRGRPQDRRPRGAASDPSLIPARPARP